MRRFVVILHLLLVNVPSRASLAQFRLVEWKMSIPAWMVLFSSKPSRLFRWVWWFTTFWRVTPTQTRDEGLWVSDHNKPPTQSPITINPHHRAITISHFRQISRYRYQWRPWKRAVKVSQRNTTLGIQGIFWRNSRTLARTRTLNWDSKGTAFTVRRFFLPRRPYFHLVKRFVTSRWVKSGRTLKFPGELNRPSRTLATILTNWPLWIRTIRTITLTLLFVFFPPVQERELNNIHTSLLWYNIRNLLPRH